MNVLARAAFVAVVSMAVLAPASAQTFPTKPIRLVVPLGPGGGYDFAGRLMADGLAKELGQPVVVENRTGAGTVVGTNSVAKSEPDGYTIVVGGLGSIALAPALAKDLPFDPARDLVPLQLFTTNSYTLSARADFGPKNLQEIIAYARANPGKVTIGTPGPGTGQAVAMSLLKSLAGLDLLEVQYKNAPPIYIDMLAGRVDLFFDATSTAQPFVTSGKVRGIATSGSQRDFILPDVPTVREAGVPDYLFENWTGLFAPGKTPRPIVLRYRQVITKIAATPEFQKTQRARGYGMFQPDNVDAFILDECKRWPALLAKAGVKPQ
jgi:tripartite-type tricarboxylate transporter receptor subunit TctC